MFGLKVDTFLILRWILFLGVILLLTFLAKLCFIGFDITDEGFYLNVIQSPNRFKETTTQFGFILSPFFSLLGENVGWFRLTNIAAIYLLGCCCIYLAVHSPRANMRQKYSGVLISFIAGFSFLSFLGGWLATPGYNSLNLISLQIVAIGLMLSEHHGNVDRGALFIGLGGGLCFFAKPSSALVLACAISIYLIFFSESKLRSIAVSVCACILSMMVFLLCAGVSPIEFVLNFLGGLEISKAYLDQRGGYSIFWNGEINLSWHQAAAFGYVLLIFFFLRLKGEHYVAKVFFRCVSFILAVMLVVYFSPLSDGKFNRQMGVAVLGGLAFGVCFTAYSLLGRVSILRKKLSVVVIFMFFPYIYSFGTNNNYFYHMVAAYGFILTGVLALLPWGDSRHRAELFCVVVIAFFMTLPFIIKGIDKPYRLAFSLYESKLVSTDVPALTGLMFDEQSAQYFNNIHSAAYSNGFHEGLPLLDLTGASPGVSFILGAESVGGAWLIGSYGNSDAWARYRLRSEGMDLVSRSWLLTEAPQGRGFDDELLEEFGLSIKSDFVKVADVILPKKMGGRKSGAIQSLYRPMLDGELEAYE